MIPQPATSIRSSSGLRQWLQDCRISLGFTTYQTNRLFLVGCKPEGRLAVNERVFDKPMGLYADRGRLIVSTRYQIWQLENRLAPGETHSGSDRLYVPSRSHTTGNLSVHDVAVDKDGDIVFVNTDFSCVAHLCPGHSFEPVWQPPFIGKLKAEDRCHLNGLAMRGGEPAYATACGATDEPAGWRNCRTDGGIVMHIPSNEIIAAGLSMPHSPRWYKDKLWLLNSGSGEFGFLDGGRFIPLTFCPGFARGLAFVGDYALVGLSKLRSQSFGGLLLEQRLADMNQSPQCGLLVIDLNSGAIVQALHIDGTVEELFDVVVLPDVQWPRALGFQDDDIERLINFPGSDGLVTTKPTVKRSGIGNSVQTAGLPRVSQLADADGSSTVKYQRVYHLNPDNLVPYDAMTYPSLQARWQAQAQRGELLGVSASVNGEMVGFAIAEQFIENALQRAELISLFVLPDYRGQGIATALVKHLQQLRVMPLAMPAAKTI